MIELGMARPNKREIHTRALNERARPVAQVNFEGGGDPAWLRERVPQISPATLSQLIPPLSTLLYIY